MASDAAVKAAWIGGICAIVAALIPLAVLAQARGGPDGSRPGSLPSSHVEASQTSPPPQPKSATTPSTDQPFTQTTETLSSEGLAEIKLSKDSGPVGSEVTVQGKGFPPSAIVLLSSGMDQETGGPLSASRRTATAPSA